MKLGFIMKKLLIATTISSLFALSSNALATDNAQQATEVGKDVKINFKVNGGVANLTKGNENELCLLAGSISQAKVKGNAKLNFKVNGAVVNGIYGNKNKMNVVLGSVGQGSCK